MKKQSHKSPTKKLLGVTAPKGFSAGAAQGGIKPGTSRLDVALIVSEQPAAGGGVFTQNLVKAEPVLWSRAALKGDRLMKAVLINSGNANACTGDAGRLVVTESAEAVAQALGCSPKQVLLMSTGVIGVPLAKERLVNAVPHAAAALGATRAHAADVARAIMTTDSRPKEAVAHVTGKHGGIVVGGMAKGSGMIHPNMATMLGVVTTDAGLSPAQAKRLLRAAVDDTFNAITVDGDTSTNDCVFLLANGASGVTVAEGSSLEADVYAGVVAVCRELAEAVAADGEGAEKLIVVRVHGAQSDKKARLIARTICASPLVKTAVHGGDPNWGRVLAAAGRSGVALEPHKLDLKIGGHWVAKGGVAHPAGERGAAKHLKQKRVELDLWVNGGQGAAIAFGCDLSAGYVAENAHYRS